MNGTPPTAARPKPADASPTLRVLVLAPRGRDAALTGDLLRKEGFEVAICSDVRELCDRIAEGAATALVAEEALTPTAVQLLAHTFAQQQPWSDFPLVVFGMPRAALEVSGALSASFAALGNVTFLERPVSVRSMLAAAHAALRARRRQYEGRRAIESRDEFLAMLGHELRNPLGAIRLALDLMREGSDDRAQWEKRRDVLERQSTHLSRLVDDLLDVARLTYGKVTLQLDNVDLNDVVGSVMQTLEQRAAAQGLSFALECANAPLRVRGDRVRLEQIFTNLVTNAMKYTPSGGAVRVATARDGEGAVVRIVDTGVGIDPAMLSRVFELFAQADRSLERAQGGMGLGLTLVQRLVTLHGGSVEARSAGLGHGSEFIVSVPLSRDVAADEPNSTGEHSVLSPKRFVYVEDSEDLRDMMSELLTAQGHEVTLAADGEDGLRRILTLQPDVALVDIGLPLLDGFEVARRVREAGAHEIVLIAVSGYGQPADRARALAAGFDGHITKPVTLRTLSSALARARTVDAPLAFAGRS